MFCYVLYGNRYGSRQMPFIILHKCYLHTSANWCSIASVGFYSVLLSWHGALPTMSSTLCTFHLTSYHMYTQCVTNKQLYNAMLLHNTFRGSLFHLVARFETISYFGPP